MMTRGNFGQTLVITLTFICEIANAQYTKILDFAGASNGSSPTNTLVYDGNFLYGTTGKGGTANKGVVFRIKPDGTGDTILFNFDGSANGGYPNTLLLDGTFFYGMTEGGGTNNYGTVFKIKTDGTGYNKLLDFNSTVNGYQPLGSLVSDGTYLYGMTCRGGINNCGTIFKIKKDGTGYNKLLDFNSIATGSHPYGSLITDGTFLYGTTYDGGAHNIGVVFKIKTDGTNFSKLLDFVFAAYGSGPGGDLFYDGTFLYGMTTAGGSNTFYGTIFKIKPDGSNPTKLLDFDDTNGSNPFGSFISDGTFLYGVTLHGGANGDGTIFKINPDGTGYSKLFDFSSAISGKGPFASLTTVGSFLYGMTFSGGANDSGTIFKINPASIGIAENKPSTYSIYPNPFSNSVTINNSYPLKEATLTVYNQLGEIVDEINNINYQSIILHRGNLTEGSYFIRLKENNRIILVDKVIITDN
jgi:uncharacterized repeat protein (TIGR03803 family)